MASDVVVELTARLAGVPPFTPWLVQLAWRLCDDAGECDMELAVQLAGELNAALDEARAYARAVEAMRWQLGRLS